MTPQTTPRWQFALLAVMLAPVLLRWVEAPVVMYQASVVLLALAGLASLWMSRRTFSRRDPVTWLFGAMVGMVLFIEIGRDYYSFLGGSTLRVLVLFTAVLFFAFMLATVMPLVKVLNEARVLIKDTRLRVAELEKTVPKDPNP